MQNNNPVRYGDEILLTDDKYWLQAKTATLDELRNVVFGEVAPNEDTSRFRWRIQAEPETSKAASQWKKFGQPVRNGDQVWLGCRCSIDHSDMKFDGYALLHSGRSKGDRVTAAYSVQRNPLGSFGMFTIHRHSDDAANVSAKKKTTADKCDSIQ